MNDLLSEVIDYLRYQQECGNRFIDLEPETLTVLSSALLPPAPTPKTPSAPTSQSRPQNFAPAAPAPAQAPSSPFSHNEAPPPAPIAPSPSLADSKTAQSPTNSKELMIVGETEAIRGEHYGDIMIKMISAMGYTLDDVIMANICGKPRAEKPPTLQEMTSALPAFRKRIKEANPKAILLLGSSAAHGLLGVRDVSSIHGRWHKIEGIPVMPTYHPAYLAKFPGAKHDTWNDLKKLMAFLNRPTP